MCNHLLGHLYGHDHIPLHFYTVREILKRQSDLTLMLSKKGYGKFISPKQYLDKRLGLADMQNYCSRCGEKINWKKIKQEI